MLIFKSEDINVASNYRTIMISNILSKLYGLILEKKNISVWLENNGKRAKRKVGFIIHHSTLTILSLLGSFPRNVRIVKLVSSIVMLTLEKLLTQFLEISYGKYLKR